jgi:N-methylhydantoinase B
VKVTVHSDRLHVDYDGTSPETRQIAINCSLNYTRGTTFVALKSVLVPEIPNNEGLFRTIDVTAPEGCILNCKSPVAVRGRSVVAVQTHDALFGALAAVIPDKVQAGSGTFWSLRASGHHPNGQAFSASMLINGGMGGSGRKDGLSATAYPWNCVVTPTEIYENHAPVLIERKELIPGSGGEGRYRGGLGQRVVVRTMGETPVTLMLRSVNLQFPPPGLHGGKPGSMGRILLNGQPSTDMLPTIRQGDELVLELSGGGGFGSPEERFRSHAER